MEKTSSNQGPGILYNPYLDRSRASSRASIRDKSIVEKESISEDSDGIPNQIAQKSNDKRKNQVETKNPPVLKDERETRPGFFSNMKHLLEMRKAAQINLSRGNTPTRSIIKEPTNSNNSKLLSLIKSETKVNTSIADAKVSMRDFMDNIATQKKLNHSKLTTRKFSSPTTAMLASSSIKASPTGPRTTLHRDKPFNGHLLVGLRIDKHELSSMANDLSSNCYLTQATSARRSPKVSQSAARSRLFEPSTTASWTNQSNDRKARPAVSRSTWSTTSSRATTRKPCTTTTA